MQKILLVIDEYTELEALESLLKRLGFDVLAIGKEVLVADALSRFVPELVMLTYKGRNVDGLRLAQKLKAPRPGGGSPRVALIWTAGGASPRISPDAAGLVDALVEGPLYPRAVMQIVARLLNVPEDSLIKKFEKIGAQAQWPTTPGARPSFFKESPPSEAPVPSGPRPADDWDPVTKPGQAEKLKTSRTDRYAAFLKKNDEPVTGTLKRGEIQAEARKLKATETKAEKDENERLLAEKRAFAESLFRAGKKS